MKKNTQHVILFLYYSFFNSLVEILIYIISKNKKLSQKFKNKKLLLTTVKSSSHCELFNQCSDRPIR